MRSVKESLDCVLIDSDVFTILGLVDIVEEHQHHRDVLLEGIQNCEVLAGENTELDLGSGNLLLLAGDAEEVAE